MTKDELVELVLGKARAELGYHEVGDNQTKYAQQYDYDTKLYGFDMNGYAWCAYFVSWLFCNTFGYELGSSMLYQYSGCSGAACASAALYFKDHNAFTNTPEPGAIVYFYYDGGINHTGIVETVNGDYITTIEGNSSDQVKRNTYKKNNTIIAGYGIPKWSYATNFTGEEDENENTDVSNTVVRVLEPDVERATVSIDYGYGLNSPKDIVRAWQALMCAWGDEFATDIDGEYGPNSQQATMTWQTYVSREPTGIVTESDWLEAVKLPT